MAKSMDLLRAGAVLAGAMLALGMLHDANAVDVANVPNIPNASNGTADAKASTSKSLAIGFAGPLSNPVLQSARDGALLAIEERNAAARANPRAPQFSLLEQDERSEPHLAQYSAQYFVRNGVIAVLGHWSADVALAVASIYEKQDIAQLMFTASSSVFTEKGYSSAFRLLGSSDRTASFLVESALVTLGARRIAVVANNSAFGQALANAFVVQISTRREAAQLVYQATVSSKTSDFHTVLQALEASRPDLVLFSANTLQVGPFVTALGRTGLASALLLTGGSVNQKPSLPPDSRMTLYSLEPDADLRDCPSWKSFAKRFEQRFERAPSSFSRYAYNAANVLMTAAAQAGGGGPRLLQVLHENSIKGLSGPIAFDQQGNAKNGFYTLYRNETAGWVPFKGFSYGAAPVCD